VASCAFSLVEPLHISRTAHRRASEWLMSSAAVPGHVLDTRGWTALYTDRVTYTYDRAESAFADPLLSYIVLERAELGYDSPRSRTLKRLLDLAASPAAELVPPDPHWQTVVVYRWNPRRLADRLAPRLPDADGRHTLNGLSVRTP
jgi:hypothetical protein